MADSANIQYAGSVVVKETLEAADTSNTVSLIHSKLDKALVVVLILTQLALLNFL